MNHPVKFKILIFGAGAIGTYVGGSLVDQGHEVIFLERPMMVNLLKEAGLEISVSGKKIIVKDPVVYSSLSDVLTAYKFDLAIVAVKAYDTDDVIKSWSGLESFMPPVLCLQNGVENEVKIAAVLGEERVISGTVTTAVGKPGLGKIVVEKLRGIGIAEGGALNKKLVFIMNEAGLQAELIQNASGMKWSKMLTNLLANASSAILGFTPEKIFNDPKLYKIEAMQIRETLSIMDKLNIPVVNLPGTPVRLMAFLIKKLPLSLSRLIMKQAMAKGRGGKMPSLYLDMQSGRNKSEVTFLNGAVERYAKSVQLTARVNQNLNELLMGIVDGEIEAEKYLNSPDLFIQKIC